jgi:hypothetical protein
MLETAPHIVPDRAGKQQGIIGIDLVLEQTGVTQLNVLIKAFPASGDFPLKRCDPGHIQRHFGQYHINRLRIRILRMIQGGAEINGAVWKGPGIGNTGLLGIPHDTVDVPGMVPVIRRTGKVHACPE